MFEVQQREQEEALAMLGLLEHAKANEAWLRTAYPCSRCRAEPGTPCVRPDGTLYPSQHAPRMDAYCRAYNGATIDSWRMDLTVYATRPSLVLREMKASRLYRLLHQDER